MILDAACLFYVPTDCVAREYPGNDCLVLENTVTIGQDVQSNLVATYPAGGGVAS